MIIYKIVNNINGKIYIGQTKKDVSRRVAKHITENRHYIQKALNKYGLESFAISIIDEAISKEILDEKEKYWIKVFNCRAPNGYNCTDGGDGINGYNCTEESREKRRKSHIGKTLSDETKQKMSMVRKGKRLSEEHKKKISETHKGMGHTEEVRKKISEANRGKQRRLGSHLSEESKEKMSKAHLGKHQSEESKKKNRKASMGNIYAKGKHWNMSEKGKANIKFAWAKRKLNGEMPCAAVI